MNTNKVQISTLPPHIESVLRRIEEKGYQAFLVGGCVRDTVMSRPVHDWDVATSATPEDIALIFRKTFLTGAKYGTVTVVLPEESVEVTSFRIDGEYRDGRRPENVELGAKLEEDLKRRDFTMNAMAMSSNGELIDAFGGLDDIQNRTIRCVGIPDARFGEDALRMFRAFRFSAELGFAVEPVTLSAIFSNADRAQLISAERVQVELEKTLMSQKPEIAVDMINAGLLNDKFGIRNSEFGISMKRGSGSAVQSAGYGEDTLASIIARVVNLPAQPTLRWCAFCAALLEKGQIRSCASFLRGLRLDSKTVKSCSVGITIALCAKEPGNRGDRTGNVEFQISERQQIKRLLAKYGADAVRCAVAAADSGGQSLAVVDGIIAGGECFSLRELTVTGHDLIALGYQPGPEIKRILNELLDYVIEHPGDNAREILLETAKQRVNPEFGNP